MPLYNSMANTIDSLVDCRMIQLQMDMFLLTFQQLTQLANYCASHLANLVSNDFISLWEWNNKRVSSDTVLKRTTNPDKQIKNFSFGCDADVISSTVYDLKSFRNYETMLFASNSTDLWNKVMISADYPAAIKKYLPDLNNIDKCKSAILSLFYEKEKKKTGIWRNHDATALFVAQKHGSDLAEYCGCYTFRIALNCLSDPEAFAQELKNFVLAATQICPNINATIALSPIGAPARCSAHMLYFGGRAPKSYIDTCVQRIGKELYPYYHIYGAEWFNLLSPLVSDRLHKQNHKKGYNNIVVNCYPDGTTTVTSTVRIDKLDVHDLINVRKYLYTVLFPGSCKIRLTDLNDSEAFGYLAKPRQEWEVLPIFPEEIVVTQNEINFVHKDTHKTGDGLHEPF